MAERVAKYLQWENPRPFVPGNAFNCTFEEEGWTPETWGEHLRSLRQAHEHFFRVFADFRLRLLIPVGSSAWVKEAAMEQGFLCHEEKPKVVQPPPQKKRWYYSDRRR